MPQADIPAVIDKPGLDRLIETLKSDGYRVVGPCQADGAITYEEIDGLADMPVGCDDEQEGGRYRLNHTGSDRLFDYVVGPHSWKRWLFPSKERLLAAHRTADGMTIEPDPPAPAKLAFIGARPCELAAIAVQDRVFLEGPYRDPTYAARRRGLVIIAVNCAKPADTCFCGSMGTGPKARRGFDLSLTELGNGSHEGFYVEAGTATGQGLLARLPHRKAEAAEEQAAAEISALAVESLSRSMVPNVAAMLKRNFEHEHWEEVAKRCLTCANCTLVCPTCFCHTVEDSTDLTGQTAERWRYWDSCFSLEFSYVHGGSIRREPSSRYRQWMTHKLSTWHDQFGMSGCVGCGRCIAWCPVGIDITQEARAIAADEGGSHQ
jgi:formate hydrogenlyase subunit 6/NADH:ubiquinone oxidoreductase subunit I